MAKEADELVIPVSKYPRWLALPALVPRATLPPQSAIWSTIILISFNCISEGLEKRKAVFLSRNLLYAVSLPAPQRASTGGGNVTPAHPSSSFACTPLSSSIPSSSCPSFLIPHFPPTPVASSETSRKLKRSSPFVLFGGVSSFFCSRTKHDYAHGGPLTSLSTSAETVPSPSDIHVQHLPAFKSLFLNTVQEILPIPAKWKT